MFPTSIEWARDIVHDARLAVAAAMPSKRCGTNMGTAPIVECLFTAEMVDVATAIRNTSTTIQSGGSTSMAML